MTLDIIKEYIELILKEYDMDRDHLLRIWTDKHPTVDTTLPLIEPPKPPLPPPGLLTDFPDIKVITPLPPPPPILSLPSPPSTSEPEFDEKKLSKMKKPQLQQLCRDKGYIIKGTKSVLIQRLLGTEIEKKKTNLSGVKKKKTKSKKSISDILQKIIHSSDTIHIRRNSYDNYEHPETGLVFDTITKKVIGHQLDDGRIGGLTSQDIELCKYHNFQYEIPETLNETN
jgi:hypothetical protein